MNSFFTFFGVSYSLPKYEEVRLNVFIYSFMTEILYYFHNLGTSYSFNLVSILNFYRGCINL